MPRILFITSTDYDALKAKGVDGMIFERDEGGFFERVVTVHPIAYRRRVIEFNDVFVLHELGLGIFSPVSRFRFLRIVLAPFHFIRVVFDTVKLVHNERIDLIRATDPFWIGLVGLTVAKLTGLPLCVSIHADHDKRRQLTGGGDTYTFFGIQWPARLVCRMVLSRADMVLPIRESLKRWAVSNGAAPEKIRIIPHGIDIGVFKTAENNDPRVPLGIPADRRIISFAGRLSPENYLADLLEMARRLAARRNDFCVVIAGGGELEGWLKETLAADSRLGAVIRMVGFQSRTVCFSLRCRSAFSICLMGGFSLIEACMAGRPVVSYDVEWHRELINNGTTGFLIKEHDINGLVEAVNFLLDHPEDADCMGQRAKALATNRHALKITSEIKKSCYAELLSHSKKTHIKQHDLQNQITAGNPWYTDNQFLAQLGTPGRKKIIENRWDIFQKMILDWMREQKYDGPGKYLKMLDAGCGDGINMMGIDEKAKERAWNLALTGVDYNPVRVSRASGFKERFDVLRASLYDLPFESGVFDIVLCNHVLEHIPDLSKAIAELRRVLNKNGLFIVGIPNEGCFMAYLRNHILQRSILKKTDHINFFTKKSFSRQILKSGFVMRSVEGETFFFPISYINVVMNEYKTGHAIMSLLRRMFPSQAGGLIFAFKKY